PAEPMVWTRLFSRMVEPPSFLSSEMESTAMGIEAETVRPAFSARYTVEAPKMSPKTAPVMTALGVNSATFAWSGTYGLNSSAAGAITSAIHSSGLAAEYRMRRAHVNLRLQAGVGAGEGRKRRRIRF